MEYGLLTGIMDVGSRTPRVPGPCHVQCQFQGHVKTSPEEVCVSDTSNRPEVEYDASAIQVLEGLEKLEEKAR